MAEINYAAAHATRDLYRMVGQLVEIVDQLAGQVEDESLYVWMRNAMTHLRAEYAASGEKVTAIVEIADRRWYPNG